MPKTNFFKGVSQKTGKMRREIESNWRSMKLNYEDYAIDKARLEVLANLFEQFLESLEQDVSRYADDPLSTLDAVHIGGTEEQSICDLWYQKRFLLITGSIFQVIFASI